MGREDDDQSPQQSGPAIAKGQLACPFYCRDRENHQSCLMKVLKRICDVRQHLKRDHVQISWCPRCGATFQKDENYAQRDKHISSCEADLHPSPPPGMTAEQVAMMGRAGGRKGGSNVTERWCTIWDILFPGEARPQSPYIDVPSEWRRLGARAAVEQYLREGRLRQFMADNMNGFMLRYTLEYFLEDVIRSYDPTYHLNVDLDDNDSNGRNDGNDCDDNDDDDDDDVYQDDELNYLQDG